MTVGLSELLHHPDELRRACEAARARGQRVAVVPTMGALHRGHAALVEEAARRADFVVVTVFVNPTQFGPTEDFARYPRTLDADRALAEGAGAEAVFAPEASAMYAAGEETRVSVGRTAAALCGASRPGHFEGVATVVAKLFALVGPSVAVFGKKDYQQVKVIERMARDLFFPVEIVAHPTVRELDGVALSSRNRYLGEADRLRARALPGALAAASQRHASGERRVDELGRIARSVLEPSVDSIDYVTLADPETVQPLEPGALAGERVLLAIAAKVGAARLIDNSVLGEDPPPRPTGEQVHQ
jgi:pantoate--beta-alanine ligase